MPIDLTKTYGSTENQSTVTDPIQAPTKWYTPQERVQTTTPVGSEVSIISSQSGLDTLKKAEQTVQSVKGTREERQAELERLQKEAERLQKEVDAKKQTTTEPSTSTFVNEQTGQEVTRTGDLTKDERDRLEAQGYILSDTTDTSNPELDKLKTEVIDAEQQYNAIISNLQATIITDKELAQTVRSIKKVYGARIQRMERTNERRYKTLKTLGIRLGSRYSGGSGGVFGSILSEEERQGLARIDALEAEMEGEIQKAEQSARDFNLTAYTETANRINEIRKEKEEEFKELQKAAEEKEAQDAAEEIKIEQQANIIEQVNLGVTDPFEIFTELNGEVPFDVIKEMTKDLQTQDQYEFKTGSQYQAAGTFNKTTGEFIPLVGAAVASGGSVVGTGGAGVAGFPTDADIANMSMDARDFVTKVMRQLPTKLKDSEKEKAERQKEALFDFNRGRSIQEVVDEMNGFVVQNPNQQQLANVFRSYAVGSGVDLSEISASINNNNPEQAMTTVENAKLSDADQFFGSVDEARNVVKLSDTILNLLKEVPTDKLGAFDGRKFKVGRFAGLTDKEMLKVQQLETALATLNSPVRVSLIGTAGTEQEMAKITALQADILDQPEVINTIVSTFRDGVVDIHNEARNQRGLPTVNREQLIDNEARLKLYESKAKKANEVQFESYSNQDLFNSVSRFSDSSEDVWSTVGL